MSHLYRAAFVALVLSSTACSSSDDTASNGTGTGGSSGGCTPGATQLCHGPAACNGAQTCKSDHTWGTCDCGSGSGGFPSGGSGGTSSGGTSSGGTSSGGTSSGGTSSGGSAGTASGGSAGSCPIPTTIDPHAVTFYDNPPNLADWPETTQITDVEFQYNGQDGVHVEFSKQDGADRWPDVTPPGWTGPLQYTLGMAEYINCHWVASAAIQFWYGLPASGGNVANDNQIAKNWYYDSRWGELNGVQPKQGDLVGIFVVAGNVRGVTDGSQSPVQERSNIVLVPFPDINGAKYTFP